MTLRKSHINKIAITGILSSGFCFFIDPIRKYGYIILAISLLLLLVLCVRIKIRSNNKTNNLVMTSLVISMFLVSIIASLIEQNPLLAGKAIGMILFTSFLLFFSKPTVLSSINYLRLICVSIVIVSIILAIASLLSQNPMSSIFFGYKGVFSNPNGLGVCFSPATTILGTLMIVYLFQRMNHTLIPIIMAFVFFMILVIISSSRTSLLSIITPLLCVLAINIKQNLFRKKQLAKVFLIIGLFTTITISTFNSELFSTAILSKFEQTSNRGSVLNSRDILWRNAIKDAKIIGSNNNFIQKSELGTHNTFLSYLVDFGYIFLILFASLYIYILWMSYGFSKKDNSTYSYIPFVLVLSNIIIFMSEEAFSSVSNFTTLIIGCILLTNNTKTL